eukprot:4708095-Prymnesium_polylepis.1
MAYARVPYLRFGREGGRSRWEVTDKLSSAVGGRRNALLRAVTTTLPQKRCRCGAECVLQPQLWH